MPMQILIEAVIVLVLIALTAKTYQMIFSVRNKITCTSAMMAAMISGSMAGLLSGTLFALHVDFSINSLLAMIAGIGAGLIIGLPFNAMAMLDGILAGVMGGLMGAMLGDMLESPFILPFAFILLVIYALCTVLLNQAVKQAAGREDQPLPDTSRIKSMSILAATVTVVLFTAVLAGSFYGKNAPSSYSNPGQDHHHHHMTK